jgi:precorrin-6B methylase 2
MLQNKKAWSVIKNFFDGLQRVFKRLQVIRDYDPVEAKKDAAFEARVKALFADLVVRNGYFAGMKYPEMTSVGSEIYPKLLGSYERELSDVIAYVLQQPYSAIVDIGCAEGYYAVGLGKHLTGARIYAFDTDQLALTNCQKMANINNVEVVVGGFCDKEYLLQLDLGKKALLFMDCEGYELNLIDAEVAKSFSQHDFLIESHDFINLETTQRLLQAFSCSHTCQIVQSVDDIIKAYQYDYPELKEFNLAERRMILAEKRPRIMQWIFAKSSGASRDSNRE